MAKDMNYQKSNDQIGSQQGIQDLFKKLYSWSKERKESQRQLDYFLSLYGSCIDKEANDITEEVHALHAQLSVIKKERNDLLLAVNKMSGEILKLRAQISIPTIKPFPEGEDHYKDIQEEDCQDSDIQPMDHPDTLEYEDIGIQEMIKIRIESHGQDEFDYVLDQTMQQDDLDHSTLGKLTNSSVNDFEHIQDQEEVTKSMNEITDPALNENLDCHNNIVHSESHICPECDFVFFTSEDLVVHLKSTHSNLECNKPGPAENNASKEKSAHSKTSEETGMQNVKTSKSLKSQNESVNRVSVRYLKCQMCLYETPHRDVLNRHISGVHGKKHVCGECGYAASLGMAHLKRHINDVHGNIRNHVCEECGYAAKRKNQLKQHREYVHKMGENKFRCEDCDYASSNKGHVNRHMESVHKKGERKYKCEDCDYAAYENGTLRTHVKNVHLRRDKCD